MKFMDLSVVTVTFNASEQIREQLKSVKDGCQNILFEQFVVDNGSTDNTIEIIEKEFPQVKIIKMGYNAGFGAANNAAAKLATGKFLFFLNPDMRVDAGSLDKITEWMQNRPAVGLVSCKLINEHGQINLDAQPRRFPGLWDQLAIILKIPHLFPKILNNYLFKDFNPDAEQEVDSVRGSFMIMRREIYDKLGWAFDPRYFIWFEDVDICREVKRLGYKVMHTPIISCVDYVGQTFKKQPSALKQKWFLQSMIKYFKKWEPWYKWLPIAALAPAGMFMANLKTWFTKK